ncbi:hypothetical protein WDZ92_00455 [Nostoc sp. NIES-2111]
MNNYTVGQDTGQVTAGPVSIGWAGPGTKGVEKGLPSDALGLRRKRQEKQERSQKYTQPTHRGMRVKNTEIWMCIPKDNMK